MLNKLPVQPFNVHVPPDLDSTKVAYAQVNSLSRRTFTHIIKNNEILFGGGAAVKTMYKWVEDCMFFTERFIELGKISTDQQVLYGMVEPFIHKNIGNRRIAIQSYGGNEPSKWLYLGYLCIKPT